MKKVIFLLLALFASCSQTPLPYPYRLALCAMFKNEAPWLKEWLDYHIEILGVDYVYLYNNESSDDCQTVLQPYIDQKKVELIEWDAADPAHQAFGPFIDFAWGPAQLGAYNDCLKNRALGKAKWVAMIDIDEFIVPVHGVSSFYSLLKKAEKNNKGTICLYWRVFGTSNVETLSEGELLTEKLLYRSDDLHSWNTRVKSIHRPEAIDFCLVHIAGKLRPHFGAVTVPADQARIHHYWTRTEDFCNQKRKVAKEQNPEFFQELSQIRDTTILQYIPLMKRSAER